MHIQYTYIILNLNNENIENNNEYNIISERFEIELESNIESDIHIGIYIYIMHIHYTYTLYMHIIHMHIQYTYIFPILDTNTTTNTTKYNENNIISERFEIKLKSNIESDIHIGIYIYNIHFLI